ncbi:hydrogenase-4 component G [Proteus mirabilis]|uniref:Hydrogenase-4 component G n=1 Tax=Proteus mirabilis TaxID=584 RepID=A0A2X2C8P8_PROMI|nr:hydrogenase-4 component G [Proteus mirabilis]
MSYQNYVSRKEGNELGAGYVAKVREKFPSAILDEERQTADQLTITVKTGIAA